MAYSDQVFLNVTRSIDTDVTDTQSLITAEFTCLRQIRELVVFLRKYAPGFRNADLCSIQPWMGTRESRRIAGRKTVTETDLEKLPIPEDAVAITAYNVDIHGQDSGGMMMKVVEHGMGIPYGCLLPRDIEGLIMSGRTISVDQTIFAMTRIMATCLAVGQAAGTAAGLSHTRGILPSQLNPIDLRNELSAAGAVIGI